VIADVEAKRDSKNRKKGTVTQMETTLDSAKYFEIVTKSGGLLDTVKAKCDSLSHFAYVSRPPGFPPDYLLCSSFVLCLYLNHTTGSYLYPRNDTKMHWLKCEDMVIQHDGARPHTGKGNEEMLKKAGVQDGWKIRFVSQPAQSPDTNIMDLGFFNSLKKKVAKDHALSENTAQVVEPVMVAYENYDRRTIDRIWGHQYAVYGQIQKHLGGNDYSAPHRDVRKNQKDGKVLSLAMNITATQMNAANKW